MRKRKASLADLLRLGSTAQDLVADARLVGSGDIAAAAQLLEDAVRSAISEQVKTGANLADFQSGPLARPSRGPAAIGNGRRGKRVKAHAVQQAGGRGIIRSCGEQEKIAADENGPTMLYKYCSVATAEKIFRDGAVLLNPAVEFNDPFEMNCRIHWPNDDELRRRIDRQLAHLPESERARVYEKTLHHKRVSGSRISVEARKFLLQHAGVSCFSETRENNLMWSHYADGHKGVCIGLSIGEFMLSLECLPVVPGVGSGHVRSHSCAVQYRDVPPTWEAWGETVEDVVAAKARCWEYEREWRIFAPQVAKKKQKFLPVAFRQVVFGARIAEEDKARMARAIAKTHPAVEFLKAEISQEKYKVEFSAHAPPRE